MRGQPIPLICFALNCLLVWAGMHGIAGATMPTGSMAHHDLTIRLFPEKSELEGRDLIRIQRPEKGTVHLLLSPRTRIHSVRIDGHDHPYSFNRGRMTVNLDRSQSTLNVDLSIEYTCRFDDPAPVRPVNTDNPGFGVSGTISTSGTFLLSGAGWYPHVADARQSFGLTVDGPDDTVAVTAGRLLGIDRRGARTVSRWRIDNHLEGLSLSAGPYVVEKRIQNGLTATTYLFPGNQALAPRYLEASLRHLKRYNDLFGAYPFDGFAVVENFFPTGYGFPGYTLMGGRVLQLPFIPETSLSHEIVHSWWGNGVLVDAASGNWCEGLTSYTADYLIKEQASSRAAVDYRRQALRNYATLVSPAADFPLSRFRSRTDPVTKAVGYDKSTMVFHMLRREVGEDAFWASLRHLYGQFRFKHASWKDLQERFEAQAGRPLDTFFRQWVYRPGALQIRLENVRPVEGRQGWRTVGRLVQQSPFYDVTLELALDTDEGPVGRSIHLSDRLTEFEIITPAYPRSLTADPDHHLFRRLIPEEMPPTVNTLKGSTTVAVVIADRLGQSGEAIALRFSEAMGLDNVRMVREADFIAAKAGESNLLFVGLPGQPEALRLFPRNLKLTPEAFDAGGRHFDGSGDVLFAVNRHPDRSGDIVALLHPLSVEAADQTALKIPHYGRYSYLGFSDGSNRIKGTWAVNDSPVMVRWHPVPPNHQGDPP
ncbi:M1 family metallopeptidase [Desulfosarcina sp.]|uniref:M1 family metallopeptidase n=1 Tax=Desulfosarcina sp. TaxID=2027861 RepID=UPI003561D90D